MVDERSRGQPRRRPPEIGEAFEPLFDGLTRCGLASEAGHGAKNLAGDVPSQFAVTLKLGFTEELIAGAFMWESGIGTAELLHREAFVACDG